MTLTVFLLFIILLVVGVVMWLIDLYVPSPANIFINIIIIVLLVSWLLYTTGLGNLIIPGKRSY